MGSIRVVIAFKFFNYGYDCDVESTRRVGMLKDEILQHLETIHPETCAGRFRQVVRCSLIFSDFTAIRLEVAAGVQTTCGRFTIGPQLCSF